MIFFVYMSTLCVRMCVGGCVCVCVWFFSLLNAVLFVDCSIWTNIERRTDEELWQNKTQDTSRIFLNNQTWWNCRTWWNVSTKRNALTRQWNTKNKIDILYIHKHFHNFKKRKWLVSLSVWFSWSRRFIPSISPFVWGH